MINNENIGSPKSLKSNRKYSSNMFFISFQNDLNIKQYLEEPDSDEDINNDTNKNKDPDKSEIFLINNQTNESNNVPYQARADFYDEGIQDDNIENKTNNQAVQKPYRSFINRLVGPVDPGSIRGSIFNLSIFSLGSGCLALPQKIGQMSIVVAVIDIFLSGLATFWTLNLLVQASRKVKNVFNYSKVVEMLYGKKLANFLVLTILIYTFGILILYQVITYKLIGGIVNDIGGYGYASMNDFVTQGFWGKYSLKFPVMYGVVITVLLPLCLLKDMSKLRFSSIFGVLSLLFVMIIIIIQTPVYYANYLEKKEQKDLNLPDINVFDFMKGIKNLYFFKGSATIFYSFTCHIAAFPILKGLKDNVNRRIQKVFSRSLILDAIIYLLIGICGYLTSPVDTPDLIIERKKLEGSSDNLMLIGRILFLFTLLMKIPASYISFRITFLQLIDYPEEEVSDKL